ncbi:helix-turn-helix domain-containing protein [Patescibacteria group bacterium]|nr:helix-turn-helix domain-containing protein [Patescibacteria group bacterium]MBU1016128.1 helix-turn-helix domain-containing protein [Patescibacteria group bacterium]MBU1684871.1 helix-turn-helix domain-containing protein [Patescibacteria group bacterium]MBU1938587.1 helix-turn-helix domain-containing protein [Patescibacteria group bacterium]
MSENYQELSIGEAAGILGVSIETLRRWDRAGKLQATRTQGGQRRYTLDALKPILEKDLFWNAKLWAMEKGKEPYEGFYCPTRPVFEARNSVMEKLLERSVGEVYSLISTSAGEMGNNSFDHNLGKWPDIPGIYFNYSISERKIVLADRGLGILKTLQQIIPGLKDHSEALNIAFTEVITGRAPEKRGNGLKYVKRNVENGYFSLTFQTGNAQLILKSGETLIMENIKTTASVIRGCIALIEF